MLNSRLTAARRIAEALVPSEADIESAIASTSRLIGAIAEARAGTKLPVAMGQESLAALARDRVHAGLSAYGMGDVSDCPPASAELKLVDGERSAA
jgi:hypothetical protein